MKKIVVTFFAAVFVLSMLFMTSDTTSGNQGKFVRSRSAIPNRYIVLFDDTALSSKLAPAREVSALTSDVAKQYGARPDRVYSTAMKGFAAQMSAKEAMMMSRDPRVRMVEEDGLVSISATQPNPPSWGLDRVDQRQLPLNGSYNYEAAASNVNVYVIDTGIRPSHVEFGGRATADYDALIDGQNGIDCNGHGTHVAATVGGNTVGVARGVRIHGIRALPCSGTGPVSNVLAAVDWVTANYVAPAVVNMSLGGDVSTLLDFVVEQSIAGGLPFVIAAGNATDDACLTSPARVPSAITIGATGPTDNFLYFSNYGTCVDLLAPGDDIRSAWFTGDQIYRSLSGTSMATPHVTGIAALYLSTHPNATPAEIANVVISRATPGVISGLPDTATPNLIAYSEPPVESCGGTEYESALALHEYTYLPNQNGFQGPAGNYSSTLNILDSMATQVSLEKRSGTNWYPVATSLDEAILNYTGQAGTYRWKVESLKGGSPYTLCTNVQ
jgi:subtilisin family serine protease